MAKTTEVGLAQDDVVVAAAPPGAADVKVVAQDERVASSETKSSPESDQRRRASDESREGAASADDTSRSERGFDFAAFLQTLESHSGGDDDLDAALDDAITKVVDVDHLVVLAGLYRRAAGRVDAVRRVLRDHGQDGAALVDRLHLVAARAACLDSMLALAEAGHAVSQHALALMYSERQRPDQFESWLGRAADSGHALSMMGMVSLLAQRDPQRSFAYARRAADAGLRTAQYVVGRCLILGQGVQADLHAGLQYVVAAADAGLADAQVLAGGLYIQQQPDGVESDPDRAMRYFQAAADQDNPEALYIVGSLLMAGRTSGGVDADPQRGVALIRRAADADNPRAQLDLGKMYNAGEVFDEDFDAGFAWCLRAALHGLPMAAFIVGIMHLEGMGCERNILAGCHWIERAAARNHDEARNMLATLLSDATIRDGFTDWKATQSLLKIMAPSLRLNLVSLT